MRGSKTPKAAQEPKIKRQVVLRSGSSTESNSKMDSNLKAREFPTILTAEPKEDAAYTPQKN
jgi:hypothetical protein